MNTNEEIVQEKNIEKLLALIIKKIENVSYSNLVLNYPPTQDLHFDNKSKSITINRETEKGRVYNYKDNKIEFNFTSYFIEPGEEIEFIFYNNSNNKNNHIKKRIKVLNLIKLIQKYNIHTTIDKEISILSTPYTKISELSSKKLNINEIYSKHYIALYNLDINKTNNIIYISYENGKTEEINLGDLENPTDVIKIFDKISKFIEEKKRQGFKNLTKLEKDIKNLIPEIFHKDKYNLYGKILNSTKNYEFKNQNELFIYLKMLIPNEDLWLTNINGDTISFIITKLTNGNINISTKRGHSYRRKFFDINYEIKLPIKKSNLEKNNTFQTFLEFYNSLRSSSDNYAKGFSDYIKKTGGHKGNPVWMD